MYITEWNYRHFFVNINFARIFVMIGLQYSKLTYNYRVNRNGTCFTATECSDNGGTASGNCAAG